MEHITIEDVRYDVVMNNPSDNQELRCIKCDCTSNSFCSNKCKGMLPKCMILKQTK